MALVVLLKGTNVGGYRTFRPSVLAKDLSELDVVNIGAAGTFVVRKSIGRGELRAEIERRVPFEAEVVICGGGEMLRLVSQDPFAGHAVEPHIVQFVSVLTRARRPFPPLPSTLPTEGDWCLRVLSCHGRFVVGLHRREMKAISCLGQLEKMVGVPFTTRSWKTILAIERCLRA